MSHTYALDTNTISYFIQGKEQVATRLREALAGRSAIIIPPVTYYEIRRGFKHKAAHAKERVFSRMCAMYSIGEMSISVWECAADIYAESRRSGKTIEDADILIAAFCIVNGYILVTSNTKHFEEIKGLQLVNWVEEDNKK